MAIEEMFVASAITSFAIIGALVYLHSKTKEPLWQSAWLFGIFVVIDYALAVMGFGFSRVVVINEFDEMSQALLAISQWFLVIITFYMGFILVRHMIRFFLGKQNKRTEGDFDRRGVDD